MIDDRESKNNVERDAANIGNSTSANRRKFLAATGAVGVGGLAGCIGGIVGGNSVDKLRVAPWSGAYSDYFTETVAKSFEEETGITVEVIPTWTDTLAKVRTAPEDNPPYDIMISHGPYLLRAAADGLLAEIDIDNIPNFEKTYPFFQNEYRQDYLKYGVPTDGAPQGIVYEPSNLDFEPEQWSDFLRDDVEKAAMEGGFWTDSIGIVAIMVDGLSGSDELYEPNHHQKVIDTLKELDENHVEAWTSNDTEAWKGLEQGVINLTMMAYGSGFQRAKERDLGFIVPKMSHGYFDNYVRVRGTDGKKEAIEKFMNHMLDPEVQTQWHSEGHNMMVAEDAEYVEGPKSEYPTNNSEYKQLLSSFVNFRKFDQYYDKFEQEFKSIVQS